MDAVLILSTSEGPNICLNGTKAFLDSVEALCKESKNEWYRVYLIRKICSQHGVEFVSRLLKMDRVKWLFPEEILLKVQSHYSPLASTLGPDCIPKGSIALTH